MVRGSRFPWSAASKRACGVVGVWGCCGGGAAPGRNGRRLVSKDIPLAKSRSRRLIDMAIPPLAALIGQTVIRLDRRATTRYNKARQLIRPPRLVALLRNQR